MLVNDFLVGGVSFLGAAFVPGANPVVGFLPGFAYSFAFERNEGAYFKRGLVAALVSATLTAFTSMMTMGVPLSFYKVVALTGLSIVSAVIVAAAKVATAIIFGGDRSIARERLGLHATGLLGGGVGVGVGLFALGVVEVFSRMPPPLQTLAVIISSVAAGYIAGIFLVMNIVMDTLRGFNCGTTRNSKIAL
ncbi:MAG: hypothetical protein ACHQUC_03075 [Chlamydiales bacterium]